MHGILKDIIFQLGSRNKAGIAPWPFGDLTVRLQLRSLSCIRPLKPKKKATTQRSRKNITFYWHSTMISWQWSYILYSPYYSSE